MALLYIGGESAQVTLQISNSITRLFQGMLLFYLLGADVFVNYRLHRHYRQHRFFGWFGKRFGKRLEATT